MKGDTKLITVQQRDPYMSVQHEARTWATFVCSCTRTHSAELRCALVMKMREASFLSFTELDFHPKSQIRRKAS